MKFTEFVTLLEYRIRNSHKDDVAELTQDGKEHAAKGGAPVPLQSRKFSEIINKHSDIPLSNRVHLQNAWLNGYNSNSEDQTQNTPLDEATLVLRRDHLASYFAEQVKEYMGAHPEDNSFIDGLGKLLNNTVSVDKSAKVPSYTIK